MGSFFCLGAGHLGPGLGRIFTQQKEKCQLFREMAVRTAEHLIARSYGAAGRRIDELLFRGAYVRKDSFEPGHLQQRQNAVS
jgi:hypothetical protein